MKCLSTLIIVLGALLSLPAQAQAPVPSLKGQLLVAREGAVGDYFDRTVVYIAQHDEGGAFGLIVNKPVAIVPLGAVITKGGTDGPKITLFKGGPVEPTAGFVLHSLDYLEDDTIANRGAAAVTNSKAILEAIRDGTGPKKYRFMFGYSGWSAGQLESEFARGSWDVAPFDADIVFDNQVITKWLRARGDNAEPL